MSTRSGKRTHGSINENTVDIVIEPKTERKTRSKSQKENYDNVLIENKRKNYVKYPSEEDLNSVSNIIEKSHRSTRKSQKNTLKEQNVLPTDSETSNEGNKTTRRQTRRTKKFEADSKIEYVEINHDKKTKNKSNKTKLLADENILCEPVKQVSTKKKSNKKKNKKKSSSIIVEDASERISYTNNESQTSNESFHSAAGSPIKVNIEQLRNQQVQGVPIKVANDKMHDNQEEVDLNTSVIKDTKRKKKITIEDNELKIDVQCTTDTVVNSSPWNNSLKRNSLKKKYSNAMNTNDGTEILSKSKREFDVHVNSPDRFQNYEPTDTNSAKKKKKANSANSNSTPNTNISIDLANQSDITEHVSTKVNGTNDSSKKKRRTTSKRSTNDMVENTSNVNLDPTYESKHSNEFAEDIDTQSNKHNNQISLRQSSKYSINETINLNSTYDKNLDTKTQYHPSNSTCDKSSELNATFEVDKLQHKKHTKTSSIISTDTTDSIRSDILSKDNSRISITSDDSQVENIVNTTPVLIESSMDESLINVSSNVTSNFPMKQFDSLNNATPPLKHPELRKSKDVSPSTELVASFKDKKTFTETKTKATPLEHETAYSEIRTSKIPLQRSATYTEIKSSKILTKRRGTFSEPKTTLSKDGHGVQKNNLIVPLKREGTYTEINPKTTPSKSYDGVKVNNPITPLKRQGTYTEINPKTTPSKSGDVTENNPITPLKRQGTYTEINPKTTTMNSEANPNTTQSKSDKNNTKTNPITPLKRRGTYTEIKTSKTPTKSLGTARINPETTPLKNDQSGIKSNLVTPVKETVAIPLKREGTFTKDDSITTVLLKPNVKTPTRRKSLPSPGCTPFPVTKSSSKEKNVLNVTRSIEKPLRRSSLMDVMPRATKVMFCSPVNNPVLVTQMKGKVIKSNLKGSNKSFIFDESVSEVVRPVRKRSYTQSEAEEVQSKRKRLTRDQQQSVERLSRPRTTSAAARLQNPGTPTKKAPQLSTTMPELTPSKCKPDGKLSRKKLPNFAALHQKQFEKMESLDECQERKAKRARQLLTPTAPLAVLDRTASPKENQPDFNTSSQTEMQSKKPDTPKTLRTEKIPAQGYTRFGFKLNLEVNPFSITTKNEPKPKENQPLKRQLTVPSLSGATSTRKEFAKQAITKEKSLAEKKRDTKRKENRTVIKGVRTNRRFELQMKMRSS